MTDEPDGYDGLLAVGRGVMKKIDEEKVSYSGTVPLFNEGEREMEVVVLRVSDWELVTRTGLAMLLENAEEMDEETFNSFPDGFISMNDEEEFKLYLDRHFYSLDPSRMLFVRYESVQNAFEEGEFDEDNC